MQIKFQLGEKVIISSDCPKHGGKVGVFQFETNVGSNTKAIIEDDKTKRQFMVSLIHVNKYRKAAV